LTGLVLLQGLLQFTVACKHLFKNAINNLGLSLSGLAALLIFLDQAIETIFDLYLCATFDKQAYFMPFTPVLFPELEYFVLFFRCPFVSSHIRVDNIDPSLTALPRLSLTAGAYSLIELFSNSGPLFRLTNRVPALHALRGHLLSNLAEDFRFSCRPC